MASTALPTPIVETSPLIPSPRSQQQQQQQTQLPSFDRNNFSQFPTLATILKKGTVLPNRGSTARDHLANERTYLAWTRTGLALIGASLGLLKWDAQGNAAEGYLIAFMGIVVLMMATHRYFHNMQLLEGGFFAPNVHGILLVITVVIAAIVAAFALQFQNRPKQ